MRKGIVLGRARGVAGTVSSLAHLSVAGSAAAESALALGKARHHQHLSARERDGLRAVAESFRNYSSVFGQGDSYLAVVAKQRPTDTLAEVAVILQGYQDEADAAGAFKKVASQIDAVAAGDDIEGDNLADLHTLFRRVTKRINAMLSSSGERALQTSLR